MPRQRSQTVRQPIALKGRDQLSLHGRGVLTWIAQYAEGVARVLVEDREPMAATRAEGPARIEVHLPQGIGDAMFEPQKGARLIRPLGGIQGRTAGAIPRWRHIARRLARGCVANATNSAWCSLIDRSSNAKCFGPRHP